ncbi:MAG: UDP-2,3-diacylglucosamine diphosphatase [Gemmatimonadales bacterium]|nr:MAG: UDP-2,3-diacylglucosamine diphosphatase [Gemmatimonadales bacterium]
MTDLQPALVVSDTHLGALPADRTARFHRWLEAVPDISDHLVINGDLFDFWYEYGSVIPRGHTRTLGRLADLVDAGVRVDFVGGNHDWWAGSFLADEIGVRVHREPVVLELAGHRCLVAHGDGLGRGDLGYKLLQTVLRGRITRFLFRWLHPDVGAVIADKVSRTHLQEDRTWRPDQERVEILAGWARDRLLEDESLDLVLLGHVHAPELREIAPGRWYGNSGDWIHHGSWIELAPGAAPVLGTHPAFSGRSDPGTGS